MIELGAQFASFRGLGSLEGCVFVFLLSDWFETQSLERFETHACVNSVLLTGVSTLFPVYTAGSLLRTEWCRNLKVPPAARV